MRTNWIGAESGPREYWRAPYTVLSLCVGAYFAVRFSQVVVGPVVPLVIGEFGVSRAEIGIALTGMWVGYALVQLPSGAFADRYGARRIVLVALTISAGATFVLAGSPTFLAFGIATVGLGIGAGAYYNPATALLTREFDGIGGVIGVHRIGGQVAGVAAPIAAAIVSVRYGWRATVAVGAVLAVVVVGLFVRTHTGAPRRNPETPLRKLFDPATLLRVVTRPHARSTTFMMTLVEFVGLAAMAFLPIFLVEQYGFSIAGANVLFAVFFAVSAICQPLSGWLSDRIGRDSTAALLALAGLLGYSALVVGGSVLVAVAAVVLAGGALSTTPVLQARMMDGLSGTNRGRGFGSFRTLYLLVGSTGTAIVGTTADVAGWSAAFGLLATLWGVVLLSLVALRSNHKTGPMLPKQ